MTSNTRQLILGGLFIALGILFPIFFHAAGLGAFMLPMFWPIAICAFYLNPIFALVTGIVTPVVSLLITGMPPVPTVYLMIGELAVLGIITSIMRIKTGLGAFWILLVGLICSRILLFFLAAALAPLIGLPGRFASIYLLSKGLPGVIAILVLIPLLLNRLQKRPIFALRKSHV